MIEIKNMFGEVIKEVDAEDLREANLSGADLRWANLSGADLSGADLRWAIGNGREIKTIIAGEWVIAYTSEVMAIGCEQHTLAEWDAFTDEEISKMDPRALELWKDWKPILKSIGVWGK